MARRTRASSHPHLPLLAPAAAVPATPAAPPPPQSLASLVHALNTAWKDGDWEQLDALLAVVREREDLQDVRSLGRYDASIGAFALGYWYWKAQAAHWQTQATALDQAIETIIDRLGALQTYAAGDAEQQAYVAWLRDEGHPGRAPWDEDPAWFAHPDILGFVCDTLASTPYYRAKVQEYIAARRPADASQDDDRAAE